MHTRYLSLHRGIQLSVLLLGVGGCALYQPMLPATPLLRQQGQAEAAISLNVPGVEAAAAYSPVKHIQVVVAGNAIWIGSQKDITYNFTRSQQGEIGLGYYTNARQPNWHVSLLSGVGRGNGRVHGEQDFGPVVVSGFPTGGSGGRPAKPDRRGSYQKYFGQVGVAHVATGRHRQVQGVALRATWMHFTTLTFNDQPVAPPTAFYLEPVWFWRFGSSWLQGKLTTGLSTPLKRISDAQKYLLPNGALLLGAGVVVVPSELHRHRRAE